MNKSIYWEIYKANIEEAQRFLSHNVNEIWKVLKEFNQAMEELGIPREKFDYLKSTIDSQSSHLVCQLLHFSSSLQGLYKELEVADQMIQEYRQTPELNNWVKDAQHESNQMLLIDSRYASLLIQILARRKYLKQDLENEDEESFKENYEKHQEFMDRLLELKSQLLSGHEEVITRISTVPTYEDGLKSIHKGKKSALLKPPTEENSDEQ